MSKGFMQWLRSKDGPEPDKINLEWLQHYRDSPPNYGECRWWTSNVPGCQRQGVMSYVHSENELRVIGIPVTERACHNFRIGFLCDSCLILTLGIRGNSVNMARLWRRINPELGVGPARALIHYNTQLQIDKAENYCTFLTSFVHIYHVVTGQSMPLVSDEYVVVYVKHYSPELTVIKCYDNGG